MVNIALASLCRYYVFLDEIKFVFYRSKLLKNVCSRFDQRSLEFKAYPAEGAVYVATIVKACLQKTKMLRPETESLFT